MYRLIQYKSKIIYLKTTFFYTLALERRVLYTRSSQFSPKIQISLRRLIFEFCRSLMLSLTILFLSLFSVYSFLSSPSAIPDILSPLVGRSDVAARVVRSFGVVVRKTAVYLKQEFSKRDFRDTDWIQPDLNCVWCQVFVCLSIDGSSLIPPSVACFVVDEVISLFFGLGGWSFEWRVFQI